MANSYRDLPSVDKVLSDTHIQALKFPRDLIVNIIRKRLEQARKFIADGESSDSADAIVNSVLNSLKSLEKPGLRRVINASGVILHTNLGRAPLSEEAISAMDAVSRGYVNLEFELENGTRGSRDSHVEGLLCQLTGAEAALVVNNNAAAVLLGLTSLARRKEVIISRGQAVEIGGGFRVPDVMRESGARLVEVGTTNRTYPSDYYEAINLRTAALMKVHTSNFRLVGFTNEVSLTELVDIAEKHRIIMMDDIGSGCLLDTTEYGLAPEPTVQDSIKTGVGLVFFSGDKLLGSPQAGIIVGKREYIQKMKRHPLARALRIDKGRLAGLAATLLHYLKGEATEKVPVWRMIAAPPQDMEKRAEGWAKALGGKVKIISGETMVGGGSLPGGSLPTMLLALYGNAQLIAKKLRLCEVPVVGRMEKDVLLLDPRTVLPEEDEIVIKALREIIKTIKK
jgi:L-seryl-tRNA(Ser) seleniumtransferase